METKICKDCGKELPITSFYQYHKPMEQQIYTYTRCIDCEREHRLRVKLGKEEKKKLTTEEKAKKKPKKNKTISDIQREAQEHGMSYGQYVAWMDFGKGRYGDDSTAD